MCVAPRPVTVFNRVNIRGSIESVLLVIIQLLLGVESEAFMVEGLTCAIGKIPSFSMCWVSARPSQVPHHSGLIAAFQRVTVRPLNLKFDDHVGGLKLTNQNQNDGICIPMLSLSYQGLVENMGAHHIWSI